MRTMARAMGRKVASFTHSVVKIRAFRRKLVVPARPGAGCDSVPVRAKRQPCAREAPRPPAGQTGSAFMPLPGGASLPRCQFRDVIVDDRSNLVGLPRDRRLDPGIAAGSSCDGFENRA